MTGGMLAMFEAEASLGDVRAVMERMVDEGRMRRIGERDGETVYALTDEGREWVDDVLLPQLGITPEEAAAWITERDMELPRPGITALDVTAVRP